MKKHVLIFLLSLMGMTAQGQGTFAPLGAEWYYQDYSPNISGGANPMINVWLDKMVVEKDTVYMGINSKKHIVTRTIKYFNNPVAVVDSQLNLYSYNDADTVFMFDLYTQTFRPLYVFNVNIGDTVCVSTFAAPSSFYPDSNFCYIVDSVKMVTYGTQQLKTYYTSAIINEDYDASYNFGEGGYYDGSWEHRGTYTERLGGDYTRIGLFPAGSQKVVDGWPSKGIPSGGIRCYTDSSINYKTTTLPCDSFEGRTDIVNNYTNTLNLKVYPNPATDKLSFSTNVIYNDATIISIIDISGRLVWSTTLAKNNKVWTIQLPSLHKGIYLIKAKNSMGTLQQKLLLE